MANKSQDARRAASKKPAGKTYGGKHREKTAYQKERDAYRSESKHKRGLTNSFPRGC
jgi:hypothetical protein